jgi:hypothetical protein
MLLGVRRLGIGVRISRFSVILVIISIISISIISKKIHQNTKSKSNNNKINQIFILKLVR